MTFPDVEDAGVEILAGLADYVGTSADEKTPIPNIIVNRTGGGADSLGLFDTARVTVECLAASRAEAKALVAEVRQRLSGARGILTEAGFIDAIDEDLSPTQIPNDLAYGNARLLTSNWVFSTRSLS